MNYYISIANFKNTLLDFMYFNCVDDFCMSVVEEEWTVGFDSFMPASGFDSRVMLASQNDFHMLYLLNNHI